MNQTLLLRDATVQDIQLELLRRAQWNALDGERVVASLLQHRDLWIAALLDRPGVADYSQPRRLLMMGLIKLRDLPENFWNADTLYLLTETSDQAAQLARIIELEDWGGEVNVHNDRKEIDRAVGSGGENYGLVSVWWD